jgi:adenine phosphoribosyltransferase
MTEKFLHLRKAVEDTQVVELTQQGFEVYKFKIFAFGERGTWINPELLKEITEGLHDSIIESFPDFDYIVAPEPGGNAWGSLIALKTGKPLNILRAYSSGEEEEEKVIRKTGYCSETLYFNHFKKGDKVLVIDDVTSTGGTLDAILSKFQELGVITVGAQVIYAKSDGYKIIEQKFSVRIKPLLSHSEK